MTEHSYVPGVIFFYLFEKRVQTFMSVIANNCIVQYNAIISGNNPFPTVYSIDIITSKNKNSKKTETLNPIKTQKAIKLIKRRLIMQNK